MVETEIDFRKTTQENAEKYFERAKRAKRKIEATKEAIKETRKKLREVKKREIVRNEKKVKKPRKRRRGKWYEKFHWMVTTDGSLVVAGRDATQNEVLFKKYLEPQDIVLHAEITGAPLTIIKAEGKEITPLSIREAGEIAISYSSGWKRRMASLDVYWVRPDQVSKSAPSGEYLPKGAFMMRGRKNYLKKMELKVAVGVIFLTDKEGKRYAKAVSGAVQAVNNRAKYHITLKPGSFSQQEVAKEAKKRILIKAMPEDKPLIEELDISDFQRLVPAGTSIVIG